MKLLMTALVDLANGKPGAGRRSGKWPAVQKACVLSHPWCAACGCKTVKILNAHHIKPFHLFPELELDTNNIIILCEGAGINCHFAFGHLLDWKSYNERVIEDAAKFLDSIRARPLSKRIAA